MQAAGIADARTHDLRRSAATLMGRAGVSIADIKSVLGHSGGGDVTLIYDRSDRLPERPAARERYPVPVVEVIRPAVRRAVSSTRSGRVGVIATTATVTSGAYEDAFAAAPHVDVVTQACPRFVELVEAGTTTGPEVLEVAREYLAPVQGAGVDTLVLGCTHYPLLTGVLSYVMGPDVTLVSSAEETAQEVYRVLVREGLTRAQGLPAPEHRFLTTGEPEAFTALARRFLGLDVPAAELVAVPV